MAAGEEKRGGKITLHTVADHKWLQKMDGAHTVAPKQRPPNKGNIQNKAT